MKGFSTIAVTIVIFALVGPAIGCLITFIPRGGIGGREILFSYLFGSIPAWSAGGIYGVIRARTRGTPLPWYAQVLWGAIAGFAGCFLTVLGFFVQTQLTRPQPFDLDFLRLSSISGVPAGALCALLASRLPALRFGPHRDNPNRTGASPPS